MDTIESEAVGEKDFVALCPQSRLAHGVRADKVSAAAASTGISGILHYEPNDFHVSAFD